MGEDDGKKRGVGKWLKGMIRNKNQYIMTKSHDSGSFSSDSAGQLDVLRHYGDPFGVDSAKVGILKKPDQIRFSRFLKSKDCLTLEAQVTLVLLSDFSDESLEGQFSN